MIVRGSGPIYCVTTRKIDHSLKGAIHAARSYWKDHHVYMTPYQCASCGRWHVGHPPRGVCFPVDYDHATMKMMRAIFDAPPFALRPDQHLRFSRKE